MDKGLQLIGAGLPRTATLSQKAAFEMLGLAPCYHMVDLLADLSATERWEAALAGNGDWSTIFEGYASCVDWPASFFYRELIEIYPDAKVLLSVRDADDWARSMHNTIWGILYGDTLMRDLSLARYRVDKVWRHYTDFMREFFHASGLYEPADAGLESGLLAQAMRDWNEEVRATVPAEQLLVWQPADGFEPICEFLDLPVPDAPFPHNNESASFADLMVRATLDALNGWFDAQEHFEH